VVVLLVAVWPRAARAQVGETVVVPIGKGVALGPTARVAKELMQRLNLISKRKRARLAYPLPKPLPPSKKDRRRVSKLLSKANRYYNKLEYDRAIEAATEARKLSKDLMKKGQSCDNYVSAVRLLSSMFLADGKHKNAYKLMNDATLFDSRRPPKKQFSPEVQRLFDQVSAEPPGKGTLVLKSKPQALIWFNDELAGLADGKHKLRGGLYLMKVYAPGYILKQQWLRVHPHRQRALDIMLNKDNSPPPPVLAGLRDEAWSDTVGANVQALALEEAAARVMLVTDRKDCRKKSCELGIFWSLDDNWKRKKWITYYGDARRVAFSFLKKKRRKGLKTAKKKPPPPSGISALGGLGLRACTLNSQCGRGERCQDGRCVKPTPVTRKWWFWTIVGAAVVGVTTAIVVPVATSSHPVIDVQ